jgi:hypothetical protein
MSVKKMGTGMTETMKINLNKATMSLKIVSSIVGVFLTMGIAWSSIDERLDKIEMEQSRFEGVMDERTRNTQEDVKRIYDIVKDWSPDGES